MNKIKRVKSFTSVLEMRLSSPILNIKVCVSTQPTFLNKNTVYFHYFIIPRSFFMVTYIFLLRFF